MTRILRWTLVLGALGAVVVVLWRRSTPRPEREPRLAPAWPPLAAPPAPEPPWRAPVDGACPDSHPVKANTKSGIYHVPGGRSYQRTVPDRCYATADEAERDGYRRAKA